MRLRDEAEWHIIELLRERNDAVHNDDIERHVAKVFNLNRLNPAEKERIKTEVSFSLSRLFAHRLITRSGDGFARITADGRTVTRERLEALDRETERREAEARKQTTP
jgi:hypothetical protein